MPLSNSSNWKKLLQIQDGVQTKMAAGMCDERAFLPHRVRLNFVYEPLHPHITELPWHTLVWSA